MGKFTNSAIVKRRKHRQSITVPVVIDVEDIELLQSIVEAGPESFTGNLVNISESSGNAEATVTYVARGANLTDVRKRLDTGGLRFITKRPKTERLCACESGPCEEED